VEQTFENAVGERQPPMIETYRFRARLPLKRAIDAAAEQAGQSVSEWIRDTLANRLQSLSLLDESAPAIRSGGRVRNAAGNDRRTAAHV
jgi:hypothetical protein